jgi:hypothetical protein
MSGHSGIGHYVLEIVGDFEEMFENICSWKKVSIYVLVGASKNEGLMDIGRFMKKFSGQKHTWVSQFRQIKVPFQSPFLMFENWFKI